MAYCTLADVNQLIPQAPFGTTTKPSDAVVTLLIDDVGEEIDASLGNIGYVTPITGTKALRILKKLCAYGVLGLAQASRDTGVTTAVNASGKEGKNIWTQFYEQRLKALCNPQDPFELSDAPRTSEQLEKQPESVLRSSVQSVTDDNWLHPLVTRGQVL